MGIWVVILEAVATDAERAGLGIEPGALDDLAEELAASYAVVTERPGAYEAELWIEEGTAGKAILTAQFLWQSAVRYLGLPAWEVVRAEARNAQALEVGIIDWPDPPAPPEDEPDRELEPLALPAPEPRAAPATRKRPAKKATVKRAVAKTTVAKKTVAKKGAPNKTGARKARRPRA